MFKQKYLGFLVIGLALGIGLFAFIAYSIKHDSSAMVSSVVNKEIKRDVKDAIPVKMNSQVQGAIEDKKTDEEYIPKTEREKLYAKLIEHRRQQDALNDIKEEIAKERWAEFVDNQPHELSALIFYMNSGAANRAGEAFTDKSYYLKHFEDELSGWGERANYALESYFLSQANGKANVLRIDCRSSMCEIAGQLLNIQVDTENYQNAKNQLVQRWDEVSMDMPNSNLLTQLFVLNGRRGLNYALPTESGKFSVPFSIFIYRNYRSSPAPNL